MNFENILITYNKTSAIITINRPDKLNALNKATINELSLAFDNLEKEKEVRTIILTGSGEKAFVAGADIKEFADFGIEEGKKLSAEGQQIFDKVENFSKPVIAAVNGFALGGGLELAMSCHIRLASDNAKMGLPEVTLGIIPGYGGTQRLPMLVGKGRAFEMIFSGGMISADEAYRMGLVNYVLPQAELMDKTLEIAGKIGRNSPSAIASAIRAVNSGFISGENGFETEIHEFGTCCGTPDFKEGTSAFLEKRKPDFKG